MKALIDPQETTPVSCVVSYSLNPDYPAKKPKYIGLLEPVPNSIRVCEVRSDDQIFPIAEPLFWTDCPDESEASTYYYDTLDKLVKPIPNAPFPE